MKNEKNYKILKLFFVTTRNQMRDIIIYLILMRKTRIYIL